MRRLHMNAPQLLVPQKFRGTYSPLHHSDGNDKACWCALCGCAVDYENVEDVGNKRMEIRVRHHGMEESRRLDWDSDSETLADAMERVRNAPFFVPEQTNVTQLGDSNQ